MNRRRFFSFFILVAAGFGLLRSGVLSCGAASPPAGIPAPVSSLMSVGNPDGSGTVTITGAPGSVNPGATVSGNNVSGEASLLTRFLMSVSWAENQSLSNTTIANTDGSFFLRLNAAIGNTLRFTQSVNLDTSKPTDLQVEGNVVSLGVNLQGLGLDELMHVAYVSGSQDSDGLVFSLPLNSTTAPVSSAPPAFTLKGLEGIGDVGVDDQLGKIFAVSPLENSLLRFPFSAEMSLSDLALTSPLVIDVLESVHLAAIGLADSTASFVLFDTATEEFTCSFLIPSPSGSLPDVATPLLQVSQNGKGGIEFFAVSEFLDGLWVVSRIGFTDCASSFTVTGQVVLPASVNPMGLAMYNSGNNALVTDGAGNQTMIVDFTTGSVTATVPVGQGPSGVAVNQLSQRAYVVNSTDNSVTSIHLNDLSTSTQTSIGLNPTDIVVDSDLNLGVVLSQLDQATVLVELNF